MVPKKAKFASQKEKQEILQDFVDNLENEDVIYIFEEVIVNWTMETRIIMKMRNLQVTTLI